MAFTEDEIKAAGWSVTITGPRFVVVSSDKNGTQALYDKKTGVLTEYDDGLSLDPDDIHIYAILRILAALVPDDHEQKAELTELINYMDRQRDEISEL